MLEWDIETAKEFLREWDKRDNSFYKTYSKDSEKFDKAEREHLRTYIRNWEENENK